MKHLYFILLACLLPLLALAQAKTVPYESTLYADSDWATRDNNYDDKTWADNNMDTYFGASVAKKGKAYSWSDNYDANEWLISPAVTLQAGETYKIAFFMYTMRYAERLALYASTSSRSNDLLATAPLLNMVDVKNINSRQTVTFTPETSGDYYFGFHCTSQKGMGVVALTDFSVGYDILLPGAPTGLTCVPGDNEAVEVNLSWTLPTTDADGQPLPDGSVFENVVVSRDGSVVATLPGDAVSFTDNEASGLVPGVHSYEVCVRMNGQMSPAASVVTPYIGPVQAFSLPYDAAIPQLSTDDFDFFWTCEKGADSGSGNKWQLMEDFSYGKYISYYGGNSVADEWLISPKLKFEKAGRYRVKINFTYSPLYGGEYKLDILLGSGKSTDAYRILASTDRTGSKQDFEAFVDIDEPAEKNVALHLTSPDCSSTLRLFSLVVEEVEISPAQITDLSATVVDGTSVKLEWTWPATDNTGAELPSITKAEIYRNNDVIKTLTEGIVPGEKTGYSDIPGSTGTFTYKVVTYLGSRPAAGEPMTVTTPWMGDETQTVPYSVEFSSDDITKAMWASENVNGDKYLWSIASSAKLNLKTNGDNTPVDDYLVSPYISLDPGFYKLTFGIKGAGTGYSFEVGTVSDKTAVVSSFSAIGSVTGASSYSYSNRTLTVRIDRAGKLAFALHAAGEISYDYSSVEVNMFKIEHVAVYPDRPVDLSVTPGENENLTATLSWTNPTTSSVSGIEPIISKAVITRKAYGSDGEAETVGEVSENLIAGEKSEWIDNTIADSGIYEYTVTLEGPDGHYEYSSATVTSPRIGLAHTLPFDTENGFCVPEWSIVNVVPGSLAWVFDNQGSAATITSYEYPTDDWLISPMLKFENGYSYELTVVTSMDLLDDSATKLDWNLYFGKTASVGDMTVKVATVSTQSRSQAEPQSDTFVLSVSEANAESTVARSEVAGTNMLGITPGTGAIALHATEVGKLTLHAFSVKVKTSTALDTPETDAAGDASVRIYNMQGMPVAADMSAPDFGLKAGVYVIVTECNGKTSSEKLFVR